MKRTMRAVVCVAAAAALGLVIGGAWPGTRAEAQTADAAKPARPTTKIEDKSCVTADCHADVKRHKALHGPVNVDACSACHELTSAEQHTYKLTREKQKLCTFCHAIDTSQAKVVHKPLTTGDCGGCHDPHGGFDTKFLREKSMNLLCKSCHQDVVGQAKHVHGPVAAGACGACHEPHMSQNKNLLTLTGRDLCVSCHRELKRQLDEMPVKHEPVQTECQSCHDPHASNFPMVIRAEPAKLCTDTCHADVKKAVSEATHKHSAVTEDSACVNCHTPHGGELAKLMKTRPIDVCMTCHDKPVKIDDADTVPAMTELIGGAAFKHGPVANGTCGGCHNVHGSNVSRLLTEPYPDTFYAPFRLADYKLCFECHDQQLVLLPKTKGLTGFRDGEVNLHYVHVNKEKRGRSCRACHNTHTAPHADNIRDSVPYGNWELPINFKPTDTGGTCAPGCHQELSYDREQPIGMPQPAPSAQEAQP